MKFAFTLSEVLIALVVIGVVSAITLPTVYNSYQKKITETKVKKVYSTLNQALERARADYGPASSWNWSYGFDSGVTPDGWVNTYLKPYLNTYVPGIHNNYAFKSLGGYNDTYKPAFFLSDGTAIEVHGACDSCWSSDPWVWIKFDINGKKGPNIAGKDIFNLCFYADKGFYSANWVSVHKPYTYYRRTEVIEKCKNDGWFTTYCFDLIQSNNWQIPDDYPW
jgi:prepilin-type N-terminal cleavage/methylation domain-containing protein